MPEVKRGMGNTRKRLVSDLWAGGNTPGQPKQGSVIRKPFVLGPKGRGRAVGGREAEAALVAINQLVSNPPSQRDMLYLAMEGEGRG